ncbi:MAG TPA: hypothetical protein VGG24_15965, partial [Paraburkholderia sp.]
MADGVTGRITGAGGGSAATDGTSASMSGVSTSGVASAGSLSADFEPRNRLKKLNMIWREESALRPAGKVGDAARGGCNARKTRHFIRRPDMRRCGPQHGGR